MTPPRRISPKAGLLLFIPFVCLTLAVRSVAFAPQGVDLDFSAYWAAARMAFSHQTSPYNGETLRAVGGEWLPGRQPVPPFIYTPTALLPFGLIEHLEFVTAARVMLVINLLASAAMFAFMASALGLTRSRRTFRYGIVYTLLFAPIYSSLGMGQVNPVLLLLVCVVWHVHRSGRMAGVGGLAGAAVVFLKFHFGLLLLPLLLRRQWRIALWGSAFLLLGAGLSWALLPFDGWSQWHEHVVRASSLTQLPKGLSGVTDPSNLSVPALTGRFLLKNPAFPSNPVPPWFAAAVPMVLCGAIASIAVGVLWRLSRTPWTPERANLEICLVLATIFEVSPASWGSQLVFLLPVIYLLGCEVVASPEEPSARRLLLGAAMCVVAVHPIFFRLQASGAVLGVATLRSLAPLLLWASLVMWALRHAPVREPAEVSPVTTAPAV
ncbi:glycosyltransferase family 87 protein [Corallococcus sp. Z5C101001]|uniref:glycosyltransferase family 87 protein n=1 Tax=Corallococcus sp. Z5C101001 TaxID=2596829 RepID=UPI00117D321D|nr:glycosyltransferase family 87 protein [Corallococcus sp. Z5C101001]TSC26715.1 DUF2029 domain-containing protein [Corallococcus sp. Z5C101001]